MSLRAFMLLLGALWATAAAAEPFHLSFDDETYLAHDYAAKFSDPGFEDRGLRLVPGSFGTAFLNDNVFSPEDYQNTHMSVRDLDTLLEVVCHHRFAYWKQGLKVGGFHPYFWGTGKLATDGGTVAFWARGARTHPGALFFQASSSFGRFEKYLMGIDLLPDGSLEAWIVDSRYVRHAIRSQSIWDAERFHHVALSWDKGNGLRLAMDGAVVASSWGRDAWAATQTPGLFHFPMTGLAVDEVWVFDRPLSLAEIETLRTRNEPPKEGTGAASLSVGEQERLARAYLGAGVPTLPRVQSTAVGPMPTFQEVFPLRAGDGGVRAPFVIDGKDELAWPQDYTSFTNILGDSDFHPEQIDFFLPHDEPWNVAFLRGNLGGVQLLAGARPRFQSELTGHETPAADALVALATAPTDAGLVWGVTTALQSGGFVRIPLVQEYGSPKGYAPGLNLPLTGDVRIHEAAFFHLSNSSESVEEASAQTLYLTPSKELASDGRYGNTLTAMNDARNRRVLSLSAQTRGATPSELVPAWTTLHLLSQPFESAQSLEAVDIDLVFNSPVDSSVWQVTLRDPGFPARTWTAVAFRLDDPDQTGRLRLRLDVSDVRIAAGDRVWITLLCGQALDLNAAASRVVCWTAPSDSADKHYDWKALQPALSALAKIYYWYYPWCWVRENPPSDQPVTFGGYYDLVNYPRLVLDRDPDSFLARALVDLSLIERETTPGHTFPSWENDPSFWPPIGKERPESVPEWAFLMNHYLSEYERMADWWAGRQNADGQVGGGWNDDVLFASRLPGPLLYLGHARSRQVFDQIFEGLRVTRMFHGGYCNIVPMDDIHVEDLVRNRFEGILFDPGEPNRLIESMQTAWRLDKPEVTPANYIDGGSFKYDHDMIQWWWGRTPEYPEFSVTPDEAASTLRTFAPAMNSTVFFRYTDSGMFSDAMTPPGSREIRRLVVGGEVGPYLEDLSLAVTWEDGYCAEIPRWVEHASDTKFVAHLYSFAVEERTVRLRLFRLTPGDYTVRLSSANTSDLFSATRTLRRFSEIDLPIPSGIEVRLEIEQVKPIVERTDLADLAIRVVERSDEELSFQVFNFGSADSPGVEVQLEDTTGQVLYKRTLPALPSALDFLPGSVPMTWSLDDLKSRLHLLTVDPENVIPEILESNNQVGLD